MQDKRDDELVGVKSTALLLGAHTKPALQAFTATTLALWTAAGVASDQVCMISDGPTRYPHDVQAHLQLWPYYCGVGAACALSSVLTARVDLDSPDSCMAAFKAHKVCMMGLPATRYV